MGDADNESLKFATRKWYVINDQNNTDYGEGNEIGTTVQFETKSLNQVLVIIQTLIFLYCRVSNRRGGRNKQGGWQISAKLINAEGAINGEFCKNL